LLRAVKCKATPATIRFLLDVAKVKKTPMQQTYGVAALRQAIRNHDFNLIDILCKAVDIDKIEPFIEEIFNSDDKSPVSPLGESIVMNSPEIVQLLLNRGADPTAYVSFDGLKMLENTKSYLQRVTPFTGCYRCAESPHSKEIGGAWGRATSPTQTRGSPHTSSKSCRNG
jgi:hypothetical protein